MKNFVTAVAITLAVPFVAVAAPLTTTPQTPAPHNGTDVAMLVAAPKTIAASATASSNTSSAKGDTVYGGANNTNVVYGGATNTDIVYGQ